MSDLMWRLVQYLTSSRWKVLLASNLAWWCGFGAHYGFRYMEIRQGWPDWVETYIASGLAGAVAGTLVWCILYLLYDKKRTYEQHRQELAELNHVIRNAMQIITYSQSVDDVSRKVAVVDGLARLDHVLHELTDTAGTAALRPAAR